MPHIDWSKVDFGTFPDWVAGGAAGLALFVAIVAAIATIRTNSAQQQTLELQRQQFETMQEQQIRAQAAKVTWYFAFKKTSASSPGDPGTRLIKVLNASDSPVSSLAAVYRPDLADPEQDVLLGLMTEVLPTKGEAEEFPLGHNWDQYRYSYMHIQLYFEDADGNAWWRNSGAHNGRLIRAKAGESKHLVELLMKNEERIRVQREQQAARTKEQYEDM